MSLDETSDGEFAMAIAAAANAVTSLETGPHNKKKPVDGLQSPKTKGGKGVSTARRAFPKSRTSTWLGEWLSEQERKDKELSAKLPSIGVQNGQLSGHWTAFKESNNKQEHNISKTNDPTEISRWLSAKDEKDKIFAEKSEGTKKGLLEDKTSNWKSGKEIVPVPEIKRTGTPTFTTQQQNNIGSRRFASSKEKITEQDSLDVVKAMTATSDEQNIEQSMPGRSKTKADAWEKAEIAKVQKRYENDCLRIQEWENEKKQRAKRQSERKQERLDLRRIIISEEYHNEIAMIDKKVAKARAAAEDKRRNGERKTMEKANEIRSAGEIPHECCCF